MTSMCIFTSIETDYFKFIRIYFQFIVQNRLTVVFYIYDEDFYFRIYDNADIKSTSFQLLMKKQKPFQFHNSLGISD